MSDLSVEFAGERFAIRERVAVMALMRFANVAKAGTDSDDVEGLVAMYELLEHCIAPSDWLRFQEHALATAADDKELMGVVRRTIGVLSARPTSRPSDSSDGPTSTAPTSEDDDSLRVVRRLERDGRPDLALMVQMAQETRASAA